MSQFLTVFPVKLDELRAVLPKDSFIESVQWNEIDQRIEVVWSNRNLVTKLTVPVEFTMQMLHDRQTPKGAEIRPVKIAVPTAAQTVNQDVPVAQIEKTVIVTEKPVAKRQKASIKPLAT